MRILKLALVALLALPLGAQQIVGDWPDPKRYVRLFSDFFGTAETFALGATGTGATCAGPSTGTGTAGVFGERICTTGTTATGIAFLASRSGTEPDVYLGLGANSFSVRTKLPVLSNGTERYYAVWGMSVSGASVVFSYTDTENAGNFTCLVGATTYNSNVAVSADQYYVLSIAVNADSTAAKFYIDGVQVCGTITSDIPSGAGTKLSVFAGYIEKRIGTTARTLYLDYAESVTVLTTAR